MTEEEQEVLSPREAAMLNPLQMAYMGDAVWEFLVRRRLIHQKLNVHHMHTECVRNVNAAAQARAMDRIRETLTEEESAVYLRGRNAHAKHPSPRHQDPADYAESTGFEALMGYLYLTGNQARIREIETMVFGD